MTLLFVDISNWNERSYDPAKDKGRVDVVVVKTGGNTKGAAFLNPHRAWQLERARGAGMATGHYYFATRGRDGWTVDDQVRHFLANADIRPGDIIQWDWEDAEAGKATPSEVVRAGELLNAALPRNWVFLYCNGLAWRDTINAADKQRITAAFPNTAPGGFLWKADYRTNPPAEPWAIWQICDGDPKYPLTEPWMTRLVDYNRTKFTTRAAYDAWALSKGNTTTPPEEPTMPSTYTRPALAALRDAIKREIPAIKTIYTQPSGTGGYHPSYAVVAAAKPSDYSIQAQWDKPTGHDSFDREACSAMDIMCKGTLLYTLSSRVEAAMRARDPRLFFDGKPIVREYFGQKSASASPRVGYSLYRNATVNTGDNHDNHVHLSIHRWAANQGAALMQLLAVLTGADEQPPEEPEKPELPVKIELVKGGKITTAYGVPGDWAAGKHTGIDINVPGEDDYGRPALCIKPCKVVSVGGTGWGSAYGKKQVIVEYENGRRGLYAHMSTVRVVKGDNPKPGDTIGLLGYSGNVRPKSRAGTHLHYEERVKPYRYGVDARRPELPTEGVPTP